MLYSTKYLNYNHRIKDYYKIKLFFNNPSPFNPTKIDQLFSYIFKLDKFNHQNYIKIIDLINNNYSIDTTINGYNGIYLLIIIALYQYYNTMKKQYFIFPTNTEATNFYRNIKLIFKKLYLNIKVKLSHSGVKDLDLIRTTPISKFDIVIYTGGRFLNHIQYKNINVLYNTTYICDLDKFKKDIRIEINDYFNNINSKIFTIVNYNSN